MNLIDQLRSGVADTGEMIRSAAHINSVMAQAADEIERLRKIEAAACAVIDESVWMGDEFLNKMYELDAALKEG